MHRRRIQEGEKVTVRMTAREQKLLFDYLLGDDDYAERLRPSPDGKDLVGEYTLDDLEDMLGYIAAEANHTNSKKLRSELRAFHHRLYQIQRSYDDGNWNDSEV